MLLWLNGDADRAAQLDGSFRALLELYETPPRVPIARSKHGHAAPTPSICLSCTNGSARAGSTNATAATCCRHLMPAARPLQGAARNRGGFSARSVTD